MWCSASQHPAPGSATLGPDPSRAEALSRLRRFVDQGGSALSDLSPYLRCRLVSEHEAVAALISARPSRPLADLLDLLCRRTFAKGWLEGRPALWSDWCRQTEALDEELGPVERSLLQRAESAATGLPAFDRAVQALISTGRLRHRQRLLVARTWVDALHLPWQLGARFFFSHLLDGDPATNLISWRQIAAASRFRSAPGAPPLPEPAARARDRAVGYRPHCLSPVAPLPGARWPSLSESPAGLLITPEDLSPDVGELAACPFASVAALAGRDVARRHRLAEVPWRWRTHALAETALRATAHWQGQLVNLDTQRLSPCGGRRGRVSCPTHPRVYVGTVDSWAKAVVAWAQRERLKAVRLYQPPVGPYRDEMPLLRRELDRHGVQIVEYRRLWDDLHWPHAHAGFLAFKRGLPRRLVELGVLDAADAFPRLGSPSLALSDPTAGALPRADTAIPRPG